MELRVVKEEREARCDDCACVTVTDPEGKQQEWGEEASEVRIAASAHYHSN